MNRKFRLHPVPGPRGVQGPAGIVAPGGVTHQVLTKVTDADGDAAWAFVDFANVAGVLDPSQIPMDDLVIDWSQLTNIPATFPPSAHTHPANEVTPGTFGVGGAFTFPEDLVVDGAFTQNNAAADFAVTADEVDFNLNGGFFVSATAQVDIEADGAVTLQSNVLDLTLGGRGMFVSTFGAGVQGNFTLTGNNVVELDAANALLLSGFGGASTVTLGNGTITLLGTLVGVAATFSGTLTANGNIVLGDTSGDHITGSALLDRDWLPVDASWHLGDLTHRWSQIHASSSIALWRASSSVGFDVGFALRSSAGNTQMWNFLPVNTEVGDAGFDLAITRTDSGGTFAWLTVIRDTGAWTVTGDFTLTGMLVGSSTIQGTRFISTVAIGTAPLTVTSTTLVANLHADNSDKLGGTVAASYALLASPTFTGVPAAATAAPGTNTTQLATTAFVAAATGALVTGVSSVFGRTGAVVAVAGDYGPTLGGTGQTSWTLGDLLYGSGVNTLAKLAGQTTTTKKYLSQTGAAGVSAAPVWAQVDYADLSGTPTLAPTNAQYVTLAVDATLTQERVLTPESTVLTLTDAGAGSTVTFGVAANGITDAKLRQSAGLSLIGRSTNSTGNVADITAASDGHVLRRSGTAIGFGLVDLSLGVTGALAVGTVPLSQVTAGTSPAGTFTFPSLVATDLTVNGTSTARMYFGVTGETVNLVVRRVVSAVAGANFIGEKARGTFGSETYANGSDPIARFAGRGWDGTAYTKSSAEWVVEAVENQNVAALGGRMRLQIIPAGSVTETDQLNFIDRKVTPAVAGVFALGDTTLPFGPLHVGETFITSVAGPSIHLQFAKNTLAAPALPANDDVLSALLFEGWNGSSAYTEQAAVQAQASQAWSAVGPAYGTRLAFKVTPNSSGASEITPFVIDHDGTLTPLAASTNTYDLGRSTATVRSGYFGTSVTSPAYDTAATDNILKRVGTTMLTLGAATATFAKGDLTLTPVSAIAGIHTDTVDGTDTAVLKVGPGSTFSNTRGALVQLHGNEHANTGQLHLTSGNVTGASVLIQNKGTTVVSVTDLLMAVTGVASASTRMTAPLFGTTTATDVVIDRNSVAQLTLGSLTATFAGNVATQATGFTIVAGLATGAAETGIAIRAAAGQNRFLYFSSGSTQRWQVGATSAAESGANAGSPFVIRAIDDAGSVIDTPVTITRASGGTFALSRPLVIGTDPTGSQSLRVGGLTHFLSTTANQFRLAYSTSQYWDWNVTSVGGLELLPTGTTFNLAFFGAGSYGGGKGVVFHANAATDPTTNPTGGGIMYASAGAGKWRGSSGTVTTFGPAEPHCPVCHSDFGVEYESPRYGYLALCLHCLGQELGQRPWIRHQRAA